MCFAVIPGHGTVQCYLQLFQTGLGIALVQGKNQVKKDAITPEAQGPRIESSISPPQGSDLD